MTSRRNYERQIELRTRYGSPGMKPTPFYSISLFSPMKTRGSLCSMYSFGAGFMQGEPWRAFKSKRFVNSIKPAAGEWGFGGVAPIRLAAGAWCASADSTTQVDMQPYVTGHRQYIRISGPLKLVHRRMGEWGVPRPQFDMRS